MANRKSGILLHPSSLPSAFGVGDFGQAAYTFLDRLAEAKQTLWQILPLVPTDAGGSPYSSASAFAGNPLLISPELLLKAGLLEQADLSQLPDFNPDRVDCPCSKRPFKPFGKRIPLRIMPPFRLKMPTGLQITPSIPH